MSFIITCVLYFIVHFLIVGTVFGVAGIKWWSFIIFFVLWGLVDTIIKGFSGKRASSSVGKDHSDEEALCPVCMESGGSWVTRCPKCDQFVHRSTCLSKEKFHGGRGGKLCKICSGDKVLYEESTEPQEGNGSGYYTHDDSIEAGPSKKPLCLECGEEFGEGPMTECSCCKHLVHSATCLSEVRVPGARLCITCYEDQALHEEPTGPPTDYSDPGDDPESYIDEAAGGVSAPGCPDCGTALMENAKYCFGCGNSVAPPEPDPEPEPGPEPPERVELTPEQREAQIQMAVVQLTKLGGAAIGQQRSGNAKGYTKIQEQIVDVGNRLKELGGISLVDGAYSRLERESSGSIVREITLSWKGSGGISGWSM
ncbi:MAG: hypothetical protein ACYS8I_03295 [Planctomycetota bacterium]|jgi:hypothetical protein